MEKEDLPQFAEWLNKPEFFGEYNPLRQMSRTETEKMLENPLELKPFFIEKKDGSKIGFIAHFLRPARRRKAVGNRLFFGSK
jgi:hypothetical protein